MIRYFIGLIIIGLLTVKNVNGQLVYGLSGKLIDYESGISADSMQILYLPKFSSFDDGGITSTDLEGNFEIQGYITSDTLKIFTTIDYCDIIIYGMPRHQTELNEEHRTLGRLFLFSKFKGGHLSYEHMIRPAKKILGITIRKEKGYSVAVEHGFCDTSLYGIQKRKLKDGTEILVEAGVVYIKYGM